MCRVQDTEASNPAGSSVPVWTSDPFAQYGFSAGNFGGASMSLQSFCYGNLNSSVPAVENVSAFEGQDDGFLNFERYTAKSGRKKGRFIGVRQRGTGKWVAEIRDRDKKTRLWLGSFNSAEEAAIAYDIEARRIRGAKAKLNFPDGIPDLRLLLSARQTCIRTRRRCRKPSIKKPKKEESSVEEAMASEECSSPDSSVTEAVLKEESEGGSVEDSVEELWRDPFEEEDVLSQILGLTEEPCVEAISDFQIWDFEDIPFPPDNSFHCSLLPCSEVSPRFYVNYFDL